MCVTLRTNEQCCPFTTGIYHFNGTHWLSESEISWCGGIVDLKILLEDVGDSCYFVVRVRYVDSDDYVTIAYEELGTTDFSVDLSESEYELETTLRVFPKSGVLNPNIYTDCGTCLDSCTCLPYTLCLTYVTEGDCIPSRFRKPTSWNGCNGWDTVVFVFSKLDGTVERREVTIALGEPPLCGLEIRVTKDDYDDTVFTYPLLNPEKACKVDFFEVIQNNPDILGLETLKITADCLCLDLPDEECPLACPQVHDLCELEPVIASFMVDGCDILDGVSRTNDPFGAPTLSDAPGYTRCPSQVWEWVFTVEVICESGFGAVSGLPYEIRGDYVIHMRLYYPLLSCENVDFNDLTPDPTRYILVWEIAANSCGTTWTGFDFPDPATANCSPFFLEFEITPSGEDQPSCYGLCCQDTVRVRITQ